MKVPRKLVNAGRKISAHHKSHALRIAIFIFLFSAVSIIAFLQADNDFLTGGFITGDATEGSNEFEILSLNSTFIEDASITFSQEITSLKVTGEYLGTGSARVYVVTGNTRLLVYEFVPQEKTVAATGMVIGENLPVPSDADSKIEGDLFLQEEGAPIEEQAVLDETESASELLMPESTSEGIAHAEPETEQLPAEMQTSVEPSQVETPEVLDEENIAGETQPDLVLGEMNYVQDNSSLNSSENSSNATSQVKMEVQVNLSNVSTNETPNLTIPISVQEIVTAINECLETCQIEKTQTTKIEVEVEGGILFIENIQYSIPDSIKILKEFVNINSFVGSVEVINLDEYFDGNDIYFDMSSSQGYLYEVEGSTLKITPQLEGEWPAKIYAVSSGEMLEFNFTIIVNNSFKLLFGELINSTINITEILNVSEINVTLNLTNETNITNVTELMANFSNISNLSNATVNITPELLKKMEDSINEPIMNSEGLTKTSFHVRKAVIEQLNSSNGTSIRVLVKYRMSEMHSVDEFLKKQKENASSNLQSNSNRKAELESQIKDKKTDLELAKAKVSVFEMAVKDAEEANELIVIDSYSETFFEGVDNGVYEQETQDGLIVAEGLTMEDGVEDITSKPALEVSLASQRDAHMKLLLKEEFDVANELLNIKSELSRIENLNAATKSNIKVDKSIESAHLEAIFISSVDDINALADMNAIDYIAPDLEMSPQVEESIEIIDYDEAQDYAQLDLGLNLTGNGVRICLLDSGVNQSIVQNAVTGYDFVNDDSDYSDDNGHGTGVGYILYRLVPDAELIVAKVLDSNATGYQSTVLEALEYCAEQNASIISMSIGAGGHDGYCDLDAVSVYVNDLYNVGILTVAASGNTGDDLVKVPACASRTLAVAASTKLDTVSLFSTINGNVLLLAPGENISTYGVSGLSTTATGTSMAVPFVTSISAMLKENSSLTVQEIQDRIIHTGELIHDGNRNLTRLNAYNALANNITNGLIPEGLNSSTQNNDTIFAGQSYCWNYYNFYDCEGLHTCCWWDSEYGNCQTDSYGTGCYDYACSGQTVYMHVCDGSQAECSSYTSNIHTCSGNCDSLCVNGAYSCYNTPANNDPYNLCSGIPYCSGQSIIDPGVCGTGTTCGYNPQNCAGDCNSACLNGACIDSAAGYDNAGICTGSRYCSGQAAYNADYCGTGTACGYHSETCAGDCNSACYEGRCFDSGEGYDPYGICPDNGNYCSGQSVINSGLCGSSTSCGATVNNCQGNCNSWCSGGACQDPAEGTDAYGICPDNGYYCDGQSGVNSGLCGTGSTCGYYAYGCGGSCTNSCISGASSCGSVAAGATNAWGGTCCDSHNNCAAGWFCESVTGYSNAPNYYSCTSTEYPDFGEPHCVNSGAARTCEPSYDIGRGYIVQDGTDGDGASNGYRSKTIGMNGNPASYSGSWWGHQISGQGGVGYKTTSADSSLCFAYVYDPCTLGGENYYKTSSSTATWHSHADQSGEPSGCNSWREWLDLGSTVSGGTYSLYQDAEVDYYTRQIYFGWKISEAGSHADGSSSTWCCESSTSCVDDAPSRGTGGDVKWLCYNSGSHTRDANGDGNTDYCLNNNWYDCVDNTDCAVGYMCSSNDCIPEGKADGQACSGDGECSSGYCDNDGVGAADDGWCYTPATNAHTGTNIMDGYDNPDTCEYDNNGGTVAAFADERNPVAPGFYYDNRASGSSYYGCPPYSSCWVWISCQSFDGDYNSDTCDSAVSGGTWTTITTGDASETDSNNCGTGVNAVYCGNNNFADGYCCGDDANEFYRVEEAYSNAIGFDNDEAACCNSACDCIAGGVCYTNQGQSVGTSTGLNPGGVDDKSHCYCGSDSANVGRWLECDQSDFMDVWCGDVCGPAKGSVTPRINVPNESWNARYSGEWSAHGEYTNKNTLGCCGDDVNEFHRGGTAALGGKERCCNVATDCVTSLGECVASGAMSTYNNTMYYCNGGTWTVTTYSPPRYEIIPQAHQGVTAYWDLNEGTGTNAYDKTERSIGTLNSGSWTTGYSGSGVSFNSNGYIRVPDSSLLDVSNDMTVSLWVYLNNQGAQTIIDKATSTTGGVYIGYGWSGCGFIFGSDNQANAPCRAQQAGDVGQWHHIVGTVSGATRTLYVDGVSAGTHSTGVNSWNNGADLTIGAGQNGTSGLINGTVDEIQIYDRVLTAGQISELYNGTVAQRIAFYEDNPNLVLYLPFEETSGTRTHDYSPVNRDGTIVGATRTTGPSKFGNALSFDGAADYIDFGDFFNYQQFTISVWLNPAATQNQYADIIDNNHDGDSNWVLQMDNTNTNWYGWGSTNFYLPANTWTHLTVMRDINKYCYVYLNGVLYNYSTCWPSDINYDNGPYRNFRLGNHIVYGRHWNGVMDEVRIYNKDMSDYDVANLYLAGRPNVTLYRSTTIGGTYNLITDDGAIDTSFDTQDSGTVDATGPAAASSLDDGLATSGTWGRVNAVNFTWTHPADTGTTYYYYGRSIGNVSTALGSNLLARGFESGLQLPFTSGITSSVFAISSTEHYDGLYSLQHTASGADSYSLPFMGATAALVATKAQPSTFSFEIYAKGSTAGPAQLRIFCLDGSYNYATYGIGYADKTVTTSWAKYSMTHLCPAGTQYIGVRIDNDMGAGNTIYWDNPGLYEIKNNTVLSGLDGYAIACDQSASTSPTGKDFESTQANYSCTFPNGVNYFHLTGYDNYNNAGTVLHSSPYMVCTDADGTVDSDNDGIGLSDTGDGCGCSAADAQTPDDCDPGVDGTSNGVCVQINNGATYDCEIDGTEICYGGTYYENDCTYCSFGSSCDSNGGTAYGPTGVCAGTSNADCNNGPIASDTTTSITASTVFGADTAACAVSYVGRYCDIVSDGAFSATATKRCARGGEAAPFGDYAAGTNYGCCGNVGTEFYKNSSCLSACTSNASDVACCGTTSDCVYSTTCYATTSGMTAPWSANQVVACSASNWSLVEDCSTKASTETDGGDRAYTAGIVYDYTTSAGSYCANTSYVDACTSGGMNLTEYYVNGASYVAKLYNCTQFEVAATDSDGGNNIAVAGTCTAGIGVSCNNGAFTNTTGSSGTDGRVGTCGTGIDTCNYSEYVPQDTGDNCTGADTCVAYTHDCDEHLTACTSCVNAVNWLRGGEIGFGEYADTTTQECCGDDIGEINRTRLAHGSMDNGYVSSGSDVACCNATTDCIDDAICVATANVTRDADGDGDNDYCNVGTWYDCSTNAQCGIGATCESNNCVLTVITANFVLPTPADNYRSIANSVSINATVSTSGTGITVSGCILEMNGVNYTMQVVGSGASVTCNRTMATIDGTTYTYKVYANNSLNIFGNTSSRTLVENIPPQVSSISLSATSMNNLSDDNLTLSFSVSDANNDVVYNTSDYRINGTSIAVSNMPFNENISSTLAGAVKDYSTFNNGGTLGNGTVNTNPTWTQSGKIGGAYSFDGVNDCIVLNSSVVLQSASMWINFNAISSTAYFLGGVSTGVRYDGSTFLVYNGGAGYTGVAWAKQNNYVHFAISRTNSTHYDIYVNGSKIGSAYAGIGGSDISLLYVGRRNDGYFFNGTIDEVKIFNRSLSAEQIYQEYLAGVSHLSTNIVHANETEGSENWTALVVGCDGYECNTGSSNGVMVNDFVPEVCNPPASGNWVVNGNETCSNMNITITNGNVTIDTGDILTLRNSTLTMNFTGGNYIQRVLVTNGGELRLINTTYGLHPNGAYVFYVDSNLGGIVNLTNSNTTSGNTYWRQYGPARLYMQGSRMGGVYWTYYANPAIVTSSSYFNDFRPTVEDNSAITVTGLREDVALNMNISSTSTGHSFNFTSTTFNTFYVTVTDGNWTMRNSSITYMAVGNNNNYRKVLNQSATANFYYTHNSGLGGVAFNNFYPGRTRIVETIQSSGNSNPVVLEEFNITNALYFYTYSPANFTNTTMYYYYPYAGSNDYFRNSTVTYRTYATGASITKLENSSLLGGGYTLMSAGGLFNFTQPANNNSLGRIYVNGAGTRYIHGYVNFTYGINNWVAGYLINRFFPVNVTDSGGFAIPGATVNLANSSGGIKSSGVTGSDGIAWVNMTDGNNATTYQLFLGTNWKKNLTLLEGSAPYGISLQVTAPVVSATSLLPATPYDGNDLIANVTCTDSVFNPVTAYWKVFKNGVEQAGEAGSRSITQGVSTNVKNISNSATYVGDSWIVEFKCQNDYVNGTSVNTSQRNVTNRVPIISSIMLNTTSQYNFTTDNLTLTYQVSDADSHTVYNFTDWRVNGTSIAVVNMPFNVNVSDISAGSVKDYSTYGSNGTLGEGTSSYAPTWNSSGKIGGAYTFNGDDYIHIPSISASNGITVSAWINPTSVASKTIFSIGGQNGASGYHWLYLTGTGIINWQYANGSAPRTSSYSTTVPLNTWTLVTITHNYSSNVVKFYVNGTLQQTTTNTDPVLAISAKYVRIGAYTYNNMPFTGSIDEPKILNRVLSPEQINAEYYAGLAGTSTNTIISNETSGSNVWTALVGACDGYNCTTSISNSVAIAPWRPTCGMDVNSGGVYNLTGNLSSTNANCFNIDVQNVTIDCQGYTIIGNYAAGYSGIYSNSQNITIKNCAFKNFQSDITLLGAHNARVTNVSMGTPVGLVVNGTSNSIFSNLTFTNITSYGILITNNSNNNTFNNVSISANGGHAAYFNGGVNNTLNCYGETLRGNNSGTTYGVYSDQFNTSIINCTVSNFSTGIYFNNADYGIIRNSNVTTYYNFGYGLYLFSNANYNKILNTSVISVNGNAIYVSGSSNNTIAQAWTSSSARSGIYLLNSPNNTLLNSNGTGATYGINISLSNNNVLLNVNGTSTSGIGIGFDSSNTNNLTNCRAVSSSSNAVFLFNSTGNRIASNTFISTSGTLIILDANSSANILYMSNFTGTSSYFINNSNSTNIFNTTQTVPKGNYYEGILTKEVYDTNSDGWANIGADIPISATTWSTKWAGSGGDYAPATTRVPNSFSSTWNTIYTSTGSSNSSQILLPLHSGGTYNFYVDWGDGTNSVVTSYNDPDAGHNYSTQGIKAINITGVIVGWRFDNTGDRLKILNISRWGDLRVGNLGDYFEGCTYMNYTGTDVLNLSGTTTLDSMFAYAANFSGSISGWDVGNVTNMDATFRNSRFNGNISGWDVRNVTSFDSTFLSNPYFNQNISGWNTSKATSMAQMFWNADAFNQPIGTWNTANVKNMESMFRYAIAFNQDLGSWDTHNVTSMANMFYVASAFNRNINTWNTSKVTNMTSMFEGAAAFNQPLNSWNTGNVKEMAEMFWQATSFDQNLSAWNVSNLTNASDMFEGVTLSIANYDSLLNGWGSRIEKNGTVFDGGESMYSVAGQNGRNNLTNIYNWTITDGGLYEPCDYPATGNWNIVGNKTCTDIEFAVNGNISIDAGDHLTLNNVNLTINTSADYLTNIYVRNNGILTLNNTQLNINTSTRFAYLDIVNGTVNATNANTTLTYFWVLLRPGARYYLQNSSFNGYHTLYLSSGINLNITDFRPNTVINFTASNLGVVPYIISMNNSRINQFYTLDVISANVTITRSGISMLYVHNNNGYKTELINTTSTHLYYYNDQSGIQPLNVSGLKVRNQYNTTIRTSGNHYLIYNNTNITSLVYLYSYNPMNINDSIFYRYYGYAGSVGSTLRDSIVNQRTIIYSLGNHTLQNVSLAGSTYTILYNSTYLNFTQPATTSKINLLSVYSTGLRIIEGFVNFTGGYYASDGWDAGEYINRIFPVNVTTQSGTAIPGVSVTLRNSTGSILSTGTTGSNGIAWVNATDDDNTTIYQIYLGSTWLDNITMLEPTAPHGIELEASVPSVSATELLPIHATPYAPLVANVTCTDPAASTLTVYWKVYNNSIEVASQAGSATVSQGVSNNVKNVSNTILSAGTRWKIQFTCQNGYINSTAVNTSERSVTTPFSATWNTSATSTGSSNASQILLPLYNGGTYNFTVTWGDGTTSEVTSYNDPDAGHNYSTQGIKEINISGTIAGFRFNDAGDKLKIRDISRWGDLNVGNNSGYFYGCANMNFIGTDNLNLTGTTALNYMFAGATKFNGNISGWNTTNVVTMNYMFYGASSFNQNISLWNTAKVTDMSAMFYGASVFNGNISGWNTSNTTAMMQMFYNAQAFNQNINSWDTRKVYTMNSMFGGASAFNQNLTNWNTSEVVYLQGMFTGASNFNGNISTWDTRKVQYMNSMFLNAMAFNQSIGGWNTSSVLDMSAMFLSAQSFNQNIGNWSTGKVQNMQSMFNDAQKFNQNISGWDTRNVRNMITMFNGATSFNQNIGAWNVSNLTDATNMFSGVTLSTANYDALLSGWGSRVEKNGTVFSGGNSKYSSNGIAGRFALTNIYNWTIIDGGPNDNSAPNITYEVPTPANGATITSNSVNIFANISDASNSSAWVDFDRDLVGYWSMDSYNASGIYDNSSYSNFAPYFGGLGSSDITSGARGTALAFDGSDDVLAVSHRDNLNVINKLTVSAWVKMEQTPKDHGEIMNILEKFDSVGSPDASYRLLLYEDAQDTTQVLFGVINSSDTYFNSMTWQNLTVGNWYHIVGLHNGSHLRIYINGIDVTSTSPQVYGNIAQTDFELRIGAVSQGMYRFNGSIDEVMIFNRSLTAPEINALYSATAQKFNATFTGLAPGYHNYSVYAVDAFGNRNSSERNFTINSAPVIVSASILPVPANTTDTLRGSCNATDANGGNVTYYYRWYRNGVLNTSGNSASFAQNVSRNVNNLSAGIQSKNEIWIFSCLASDGTLNSSWLNSTGLNISNTPPTAPALTYPGNGNSTFTNRTPRFIWGASTDADADTLTYTINVSTSPAFIDSVYSKAGISTLYQDYDLGGELPLDTTYYWKVQAHDGTINGSYSTTFNFTLVSSINIQMVNDNITFGDMAPSSTKDTTTDNPAPFVIKSTSNTYVNITQMNITGSLWKMQPLNTSYWQIRVRSKSDGSFFSGTSRTAFFNATNVTNLVDHLNYSPTRNNVSIDMNVTAPMYEGPGVKTATISFLAEETK